MKNTFFLPVLLVLVSVFAAAEAPAVEMGMAAGMTELVDKDNLEGWIVRIDYRGNQFRVLDPRGFERRVTPKSGIIGDYKIGDKVRIVMDPEYKRAASIEKLY
jgi:hypothetical protein